MPTKQVNLGGFVLHGEDRAGQWITEGIDGWYEPPSSRGESVERPNSHGEYLMPEYYAARTVAVDGILFHKNRGLAVEAFERLAAAAKQTQQKFSVTDAGMTRWSNVRYAGLDFTQLTAGTWRFQLRLKAVDPFKYGSSEAFSVASGSSSFVHHRGTVDAWPVVTVTGSMPDGYTLSYRSQSVSVPMGLPSGVTHRIDFKNRRLYVNGDVFFGAFGSTGFRPVPPGPRTTFGLSCPSGSGTAVVSVTDTYI